MSELTTTQVAMAGVAWLGVLFIVAVAGERYRHRLDQYWPAIYALSLAVYCTAWTFYGVTTQAALNGWPIPPTFVGTILIFVLGFGFLQKLAQLSKQHNSTSIADFVASRFGKSSSLAALITAVAVIGIVPYISLQLKAVAMSVEALTRQASESQTLNTLTDSVFYVAVFMAIFAMLFGTRSASSKDHNPGLVAAMGFESLLKLGAMLALGGFVMWGLYQGPSSLLTETTPLQFSGIDSFVVLMLLGALAMFTLPHQFHITLIECRSPKHLNAARWLFPIFLVLIAMPVVPLARAGRDLFANQNVSPDLYVLMLPLAQGQTGLALFAFLGGLSAATGMVILASLTLSIMMGNHWLTPASLRWTQTQARDGVSVRAQRRVGIVVVMALAYMYHRQVGSSEALADLGALSFSGLAQLGPAVVLAVYRPGLSARAIITGLIAGVGTWAYVLVLPLISQGAWLSEGVWGFQWLSPNGLLGLDDWDPLARGVWVSLAVNGLVVALMTLRPTPSLNSDAEETTAQGVPGGLDLAVLSRLARRFLPKARADALLTQDNDPARLEVLLEQELAAVVGSASARLLLEAARRQTPAPFEAVAEMVGAATRQAQFSYGVLSGALENMSQGVCVVDPEMRLVAWNSAYLEMFDYPNELIAVGRPVADLLRHNAEQGLMGEGDIDQKIERRLNFKRQGSRHLVERRWPDGRMIEIRGNPMPGGGFVATFTDVTEFRSTAQELKKINETLEQRVVARTSELENAKLQAETASEAKTRFLAAVSHDLVQPLNAAQLLTHSVSTRLKDHPSAKTLNQISGALGATERLIESLLDISRLDAGGLTPRIARFPLAEVFDQLSGEFELLAAERHLDFRALPSSVWVETDPQLLRRILQNFLSNAIRYTHQGRIVMGVRRQGDQVMIGVWDTGPGITAEDRQVIFEEFRRLEPDQGGPGLGLGLAIAERMARLLDHPLRLESKAGGPTLFGVSVPRVAPQAQTIALGEIEDRPSRGRVLVVDNDASMRESLSVLIEGWGYDVIEAVDLDQAVAWVSESEKASAIDLLVLDYHLSQGLTGLDVYQAIAERGHRLPAVMISADHAAEVRQAAQAAGCEFLHKPIRPLALRSLINNILD